MQKHAERGFIALLSVIVISAILLVLIFTLETASFFQRFDALDAENKRMSRGLAEACVQSAILRIAEANYMTGLVIVNSAYPTDQTCTICKITSRGEIMTRARYNGAYTNLTVTIDPTLGSYVITNWNESGTYTGPTCPLP